MIEFFIVFTSIGMFLGYLWGNEESESIAFTLIGLVSFAWVFIAGPWAIATLFELILGYNIV